MADETTIAGTGSTGAADGEAADGASTASSATAETAAPAIEIQQSLDTTADPNAEFESIFAEPKPPDGQAAATATTTNESGTVPPEFQQALGVSEFIKEPAQLTAAVQLADAVLKIQNGQAPVSAMMENFRNQNPDGFAQMVQTNLIPYVEALTGMKLVDPAKAGAATEKTPEQQRLDAIEAQFQQRQQAERQQAEIQATRQAQTVLIGKADEALKGTWLEGKGAELLREIAPHMGMSPQQAVEQLLRGNTGMVEKAVKAMLEAKEKEGRAYATWKIAESRRLRNALPAGKGNPRTAGGEPDLESMTREQRIAYLQTN